MYPHGPDLGLCTVPPQRTCPQALPRARLFVYCTVTGQPDAIVGRRSWVYPSSATVRLLASITAATGTQSRRSPALLDAAFMASETTLNATTTQTSQPVGCRHAGSIRPARARTTRARATRTAARTAAAIRSGAGKRPGQLPPNRVRAPRGAQREHQLEHDPRQRRQRRTRSRQSVVCPRAAPDGGPTRRFPAPQATHRCGTKARHESARTRRAAPPRSLPRLRDRSRARRCGCLRPARSEGSCARPVRTP